MRYKSRFSSLYLLLAVFVVISMLTRQLLTYTALPNLDSAPWTFAKINLVGLFFDCVTFTYFSLPLTLYMVFVPDRAFNARVLRYLYYLTFFIIVYALLFNVAAEYYFFEEFGARFNFIAVDYLIYTTEVIRNIRESYPVLWIFGGIMAVNVMLFASLRKTLSGSFGLSSTISGRLKRGAIFIAAPVLSFVFVNQSFANISPNNYVNELAGNGLYNLVAAFVNSELDYDRFYTTSDKDKVMARLKGLLDEDNSRFNATGPYRIDRMITNTGPEKRLNVIVVVEESMSAEFMGRFGNSKGLTPNLDTLAGESLFFNNLYATGTRTVRGLEAITLSMPPLPGESLIKRPNNGGYFNWGTVMKSRGYDNRFIYAGYGYFDNMNSFYSRNGFSIVDRSDFDRDEITFSNAWGVCDEDLFDKVIREARISWKNHRPFFSIVMTTSNHRPYTYPEGRIDIPSHTGRDGSVKYADYAYGRFIQNAKAEPWFNDTVFVFVADHCAGSARKVALPVKNYRIPLIVYSPKYIKPAVYSGLTSQIDIAPTVLGLLNFSYDSRFLGRDVLRKSPSRERCLISTYERLGFIEDNALVILNPKKKVESFNCDMTDGSVRPARRLTRELKDALAYYEGANIIYKQNLNKLKVPH